MATGSFYNDNMFRSYPFEAGQDVRILNSIEKIDPQWFAGLKIYFLPNAPFTSFPSAALTQISIDSGLILTIIADDGSGNSKTYELSFEIQQASAGFASYSCRLDDVYAILTVGNGVDNIEYTQIESPYLSLEPTCVVWLQHRGIAKIEVGNQARRLIQISDGAVAENYDKYPWWKQGETSTEIIGPLLFSSGFNCHVQETPSKELQIAASAGRGEGTVQEDYSKGFITVLAGQNIWEIPPAEGLRNDGLPINDLLLYSFCGASGPHITMLGSESIRIIPEQQIHTITISVGNLGGGAC